jgi:hypothetical protein
MKLIELKNHRFIYTILLTFLSIIFSLPALSEVGLYQRIDLSANSVENCRMTVGDLNGDGEIDFLFNDGRRTLKAFDHQGNLLWEKFNPNDPGVEEQYHNFTISIYDIDLDGMNEIICFLEIDNENCLAVVEGQTGIIETHTVLPFPAPRDHPYWGNTNYYMQDHIAIANLRGLNHPQDILAIHASKLKVAAFSYSNNTLEQMWFWITDTDGYSSGHYAYPYDIDNDDRDEVLAGVDVLDENGNRLWKMQLDPFNPAHPDWGMDHVDALTSTDIDPDYPGNEIIAVAMTGMWMYSADGTVLWHFPTKLTDPDNGLFAGEGVQEVLVGNFLPESTGLEMVLYSEQMSGDSTVALFDKAGNAVSWGDQNTGPRRWITTTIDWDGDRTRDEIYSRRGIYDTDFNRISYSMNWKYVNTIDTDEFPPVVCDIQGDHREEILWYDTDEILILFNTDSLLVDSLETPWNRPKYRLRYANLNHCNAMYFNWTAMNIAEDNIPPNSPTNLNSPVQTDKSIKLNWDSPLSAEDGDVASYYRIFRNDKLIETLVNTEFTDTGLRDHTPYKYSIYAVDDAENASINPAERFFWTLETYYPYEPPPVNLYATVSVGKPSPWQKQYIPITVTTSNNVIKIPDPLILKESDNTETSITLTGEVPGKTFTGSLHITDDVAEGTGFFNLTQGSLMDEQGNIGLATCQGDSIVIDKTPPSIPTVVRVQLTVR